MGFPSFLRFAQIAFSVDLATRSSECNEVLRGLGAVPSNKQGVFVRTKTLLAKMKNSVTDQKKFLWERSFKSVLKDKRCG